GINFYFNNSTANAITAVVPWDESTGFSVVGPGVSTVGQSGNQPGSGQLSFSFANLVVTLTDFHKTGGYTDIIAGYNNAPDTGQDTTGTFTLSVGPAAEGTPPAITTPPQSQTVTAGSDVTFSVSASG